jgi:hypothetical protein
MGVSATKRTDKRSKIGHLGRLISGHRRTNYLADFWDSLRAEKIENLIPKGSAPLVHPPKVLKVKN